MDIGQLLVDRLIGYGVRRVFGVPGGQTTPFYHGLAERQDQIHHVLTRDERSAVYAADAYARVSGAIGVCDATVGPGATNLVSGLVEAQSSSIAVLAIVADIPRSWGHRRRLGSASQGCDQRDLLSPCVKWYGRVEVPEQLDDAIEHAVRVATSNRPGPVVLEIPDDVFASEVPEARRRAPSKALFPRLRTAPDPAALAEACLLLRRCHRGIILAGGGVHISGASADLVTLAEKLGAPVVTTISGKGSIGENHPLACGVVGAFGSTVANALLQQADCVVVVGSKLGQITTMGWDIPDAAASIIHLDVDGEEIGRNFSRTLALQGDARLGVQALLGALGSEPVHYRWQPYAKDVEAAWSSSTFRRPVEGDRIKPQLVIRALQELLTDDDVLVADASLASGWAVGWRVRAPGRRVLAPRGVAGLGWGLPAAMGVHFSLRDENRSGRVVCLAGDGGWAYSVAEIETLARFKAPVTSIILNNNALAWNKHVAMRRFPDAWVSQDFADVSWGAAAEALGARGIRVDDAADLAGAIQSALEENARPTVVEVLASEWETPVLKPVSGGVSANRSRLLPDDRGDGYTRTDG